MKKKNYIIIGIITIIIGILTSMCGIIYKINYDNQYKNYDQEISAKVVNSIVKSESKKDKATGMSSNYYVYAPILEYKINGQTYIFESKIYDVTKPKVNDKINIKVSNNNPKDIKFINKDYTIMILLVGIFFTVFGLVLIIIKLKHNKKEIKEEPTDTKIDKKEMTEEEKKEQEKKQEETTEMLEILEDEIEEDII